MTVRQSHVIRSLRFLLILAGLLLPAACSPELRLADFSEGMRRSEVLERFGEPERTQVMVKQTEFVLGPIETFWSTLDMGAEVEIWSYPVDGGFAELYFVDGSALVMGVGFYDEDAVY